MIVDQASLQAPRAQGIYSRTYVEQWLDSLPAEPFRSHVRRDFLAGSRQLEIGELSYHLELVGEDQYKVHCVNTEEYKRLFSILDEAADKAGFAPRWFIAAFLPMSGALVCMSVMSLLMLAISALTDVPHWVSILLTLVAGIGGSVLGYLKEKTL